MNGTNMTICPIHCLSPSKHFFIFILALVVFIHSERETGNQSREGEWGGHSAEGHRLEVEPAAATG